MPRFALPLFLYNYQDFPPLKSLEVTVPVAENLLKTGVKINI